MMLHIFQAVTATLRNVNECCDPPSIHFDCPINHCWAVCSLQCIVVWMWSSWLVYFTQGTMRVLLVLLHDFPEFLCDYHYAFCDVIPPNCIQVRNLVLSAFPRNMRLPDPFTPNLKVDMLPEITHAPRVMSNFVSFIQPQSFKKVNFNDFCCY